MAYTQADLDALNASIAKGIKSVTFADGRKTEYQTLADMLSLRKEMKLEVAAVANAASPRLRTTVGRIWRR